VPLIIYDVHLLMYIAFCDMEFLLLNMVSTKKLFGERVITLEDHVVLQSSSSGISKTKMGNCNRSYDIFQSCRVSPIGNDIGWKIWFQGILTSLTDASQNVLSYKVELYWNSWRRVLSSPPHLYIYSYLQRR